MCSKGKTSLEKKWKYMAPNEEQDARSHADNEIKLYIARD